MLWISFAWTTPALLAGKKTVTRRAWKTVWARRFRKGDLVTAFDKQPRYGGHPVAVIRLIADPVQEQLADAPELDWEAEGFAYLSDIGERVHGQVPEDVWNDWMTNYDMVYVVRFELVEVL